MPYDGVVVDVIKITNAIQVLVNSIQHDEYDDAFDNKITNNIIR